MSDVSPEPDPIVALPEVITNGLKHAEELVVKAKQQRSFYLVHAAAVIVDAVAPNAGMFEVRPSFKYPGRWYFGDAEHAIGPSWLSFTRLVQPHLTRCLGAGPYELFPELLPCGARAITQSEDYVVYRLSVAELLESQTDGPVSLIDSEQLTAEDFARVWSEGRRQLGLVGQVRILEDFLDEMTLSEDVSAEASEQQRQFGAQMAMSRYTQLVDDSRMYSESEPEMFYHAIDEAASFLGIGVDDQVTRSSPRMQPPGISQ